MKTMSGESKSRLRLSRDMESRSESSVQFEVLEYVWHSAKTFDTRGAFRKSIQKLLKDIADNGAVNFEKLLQDIKEEAEV